MGGKPRVELSAYRCWSCKHEWEAQSTKRGKWSFSCCVEKCPKCGSDQFEERFPDGGVLKLYIRRRQR